MHFRALFFCTKGVISLENVTVGQIGVFIIGLAGFIGAITTICMFCKKIITKAFEPVYKRLDRIDKEHTKNYLTEFLADVKNGVKKDENQISRATEVYDYYANILHQNSYIHTTWDKYMK